MRVHRHECRTCREHVDLLDRSDDFESCPFCEDGKLEWQATVGVVYSSGNDIRPEVRELVEEWREGQPDDPYRRAIWQKRYRQKLQCARELKRLIENE